MLQRDKSVMQALIYFILRRHC